MDGSTRPAWRHRLQRSGLRPIAVQLAAPVALGLLVGGVLAYQAGSSNDAVVPRPLGAVATPTPSFVKPSAQHGAVPVPSPSFFKPSASLQPSGAATPVATTP